VDLGKVGGGFRLLPGTVVEEAKAELDEEGDED